MFSGIVQKLGKIKTIKTTSGGAEFSFIIDNAEDFFTDIKIGSSIASNGVCLTVVKFGVDFFTADLSNETLKLTIFKNSKIGDYVNFEKSLKLGSSIDGHIVSGHIDGVATVINKTLNGDNTIFEIQAPKELQQYIAKKGSITINGVSLTVNNINANIFIVNIVPHTLKSTNLSELKNGDLINIEVDIIARHLERLLHKNTYK